MPSCRGRPRWRPPVSGWRRARRPTGRRKDRAKGKGRAKGNRAEDRGRGRRRVRAVAGGRARVASGRDRPRARAARSARAAASAAMTPERYAEVAGAIEREIAKVIVGQRDLVRSVVVAVLCEGHVLLEGVPGLGKTQLLKTLAEAVELEISRI